MELTRQDIDGIIQSFVQDPTAEKYNIVNQWYEDHIQWNTDAEYMICVYLFLLGANIRHRYVQITRDQQLDYIKEIRELVEGCQRILKPQRVMYLDCGSKSGI